MITSSETLNCNTDHLHNTYFLFLQIGTVAVQYNINNTKVMETRSTTFASGKPSKLKLKKPPRATRTKL